MNNFRKIWVAFLSVIVLAGCGSGRSLTTYEDSYNFTDNASMAIWHDDSEILTFSSEKNDDSIIYIKPIFLYEDNSTAEALVTKPKAGGENYSVYGIYQVDIYDADGIMFKADLSINSLEETAEDEMIFKFSIQEGDDFPILSQTKVNSSDTRISMEVDLTQYRGRDKFIILSIESLTPSGSTEAYWINPRIHYTFK